VQEEISTKVVRFFHDFWHVEATVINVKPEGDEMKVLCSLPDGEYQVTLNRDLSVRAFYRKKPYVVERAKDNHFLPLQSEATSQGIKKEPAAKSVKRPVLSNSEKAVLLIIKEHPGMTSYEIRQYVDIKFTMLLPILKKLVECNIVRKQHDRYFPLEIVL